MPIRSTNPPSPHTSPRSIGCERKCCSNDFEKTFASPGNRGIQSLASGAIARLIHSEVAMFRLQIAGVIIGIVVIFFGVQEYRVSSGTTSQPLAVNLADIESQKLPANNHLQIGEHIAVYPTAVYSYSQSKYSSADPTDETRVSYCYYPILSLDHPFPKAVNAVLDK
jgi:hypothetical protein